MSTLTLMKRVVTGHDAQGRSIVVSAAAPPNVVQLEHIPGTVFYELWNTHEMPVPINNGPDPTLAPLRLHPVPGGSVVRIVDIPPDTEEFLAQGAARMRTMFEHIGDEHASTVSDESPHPLMHRTESVDYGILIEGELTLVLDTGVVDLKPGDVVIQRGTNHAWANRSNKVSRVAFILLNGVFTSEVLGAAAR
jgi:hypothetical protein